MLATHRHTMILGMAAALILGLAVGCADDPHSQRRIQRRKNHIQEISRDIEKHEQSGPDRVRYRMNELDSKTRSDDARFKDRMRRLGDYVW